MAEAAEQMPDYEAGDSAGALDAAIAATGDPVFERRYDIMLSERLAQFDTAGGRAYRAYDRSNTGLSVYALVQNWGVPHRQRVYDALRASSVVSLVTPLDQGTLVIDEKGRRLRRLVTIFERPRGSPLLLDGRRNPDIDLRLIRTTVIQAAARMLGELHARGIAHRAIRADRIYLNGDDVLFGECITTPPGSGQNAAAEPIEEAIAEPMGRGGGAEPQGDFFALGVALTELVLGRAIKPATSAERDITPRVNKGSYLTLADGHEVAGSVGTLARGLLDDDPDDRWTLNDLRYWLDNTQSQRRTGMRSQSVTRPVNFMGTTYSDRRLLALAFGTNPDEALRFLKKQNFTDWLFHLIGGDSMSDSLERSIRGSLGATERQTRADDQALVARVCQYLHPVGPLRYRGVAIKPDGFGAYLAHCYIRNDRDRLEILAEMLNDRVLGGIHEVTAACDAKAARSMMAMRDVAVYLKSTAPGRGLERVVYELNPALPCLSPSCERLWVTTPKQLLIALDAAAASANEAGRLLDRHVCAYLARMGSDIERSLQQLAALEKQPARYATSLLGFFATLQQRLRVESLPNLAKLLTAGLKSSIEQIKSRPRREKVEKAIADLKGVGNLTQLQAQIDLARVNAADQAQFARAQAEFAEIEYHRQALHKPVDPTDASARQAGFRLAMGVGYSAMGLTFLANILKVF